jgi:orotidine-5'-phosphate decarboxylase
VVAPGSPGAGAARPVASVTGFGERLAEHVDRRRSQIVLGLDPDPNRLWPEAIESCAAASCDGADPAQEIAAAAVRSHCRLVLEAAAAECVAVKFQVACFERLGAPGWAALTTLVDDAREHGLLVIADAKRGDIDVSASAYGQAFFGGLSTPFGTLPGLGADALTVSPLLGRDSVQAFIAAARATGGGVFVLVRTSNPGAAEIQDQSLAGGGSVSEGLAGLVDALGADGVGPSGISDVGAVVGATVPEQLTRLRELMPATPLLLPGVGAQGGSVAALAPAFAPGAAGGLIAASRGIVYAFESASGRSPAGAARAQAARLRELAWTLSRGQ